MSQSTDHPNQESCTDRHVGVTVVQSDSELNGQQMFFKQKELRNEVLSNQPLGVKEVYNLVTTEAIQPSGNSTDKPLAQESADSDSQLLPTSGYGGENTYATQQSFEKANLRFTQQLENLKALQEKANEVSLGKLSQMESRILGKLSQMESRILGKLSQMESRISCLEVEFANIQTRLPSSSTEVTSPISGHFPSLERIYGQQVQEDGGQRICFSPSPRSSVSSID